jgi:hypothetical protein
MLYVMQSAFLVHQLNTLYSMLRVRKGYVVFCNNSRIVEGGEIPLQFYDSVLKDQSWKVEEVSDGKKEEKRETGNGNREKEEIKDIVVNRMIKDKEVKKK